MTLDRTAFPAENSDSFAEITFPENVKAAIDNLKADAVDSSTGEVTASSVTIDSDATVDGNRSLIFKLTASFSRVLKYLSSTGRMRLEDQAGDLVALEVADASQSTQAATKGQLDTAIGALVIPAAATQAEQEAGSVTGAYVSPGRQQNHPSAAKAWLDYNRNTSTVNASYNVSSVTNGGTGIFTPNWATDFSSGNYVAIGICSDGHCTPSNGTKAAGSCEFQAYTYLGNPVNTQQAEVVAYGDQ